MKIIDDGQVVISIAEYDRLRAADEGKIEISFKVKPTGFAAWIADGMDDNEVRYLGRNESMKVLQGAYGESMSMKDEELREVKIKASDRWHELDKIQSSFWYRLKVLFAGPKFQ